jgi:hypothetical protein
LRCDGRDPDWLAFESALRALRKSIGFQIKALANSYSIPLQGSLPPTCRKGPTKMFNAVAGWANRSPTLWPFSSHLRALEPVKAAFEGSSTSMTLTSASRARSEQPRKITFSLGGKLVIGEAGYSSLPHLSRLFEIAAIPVGATELKHGQRVVGI